MPSAAVPELASRDLRQRLDRGELLTLLDVREPSERAFCAITVPPPAGDLHIPMREIPARLDDIHGALARGPLVVYCHQRVWSGAPMVEAGDLRAASASHETQGARKALGLCVS